MLILIADAFDASLPSRLTGFGEITQDVNRLPDAEVVLVRSKTKCTKEFIDRAPKLKLILRGGVGLDNVDVPYATSKGIQVDNTPEASTIAVAELAMALMLAAANQLGAGHSSMQQGKWLKNDLKRVELYKKTLGIIGLGRIGRCVAERASAFQMRAIGYDVVAPPAGTNIEMLPLDQVIKTSDYISLHTPLTDQTRHLINADRISQMKKGAIVVNTGRAECVDESAIAKALESGHLGGYATDVWYNDPPPADCPILKAPNVTMMPHVGASSKENLLRVSDQIVEKIQRYVEAK